MYGDMALNLALSIRASSNSIPLILYYTPSAVEGIEELIGIAFNVCHELPNTDNPVEISFHTKLNILQLLPEGVDELLILDADTIILPGRRVKDWFEQLEKVDFTAYCNDNFDYAKKSRKRTDYTFWCDPMEAFYLFPIPIDHKMPMINASFIYFKVCDRVKMLFDKALEIWNDSKNIVFQSFRDCKTEELCFNIACAVTGVMPHQITFRPIFFQYQAEDYSMESIFHHYRALGLAGEIVHDPNILNLYNRCSAYYRKLNGIVPVFEINQSMKGAKIIVDDAPIQIPFIDKVVMFRAGDVDGSDAGVFNPDAVLINNNLVEMFRMEQSFDAYNRYKQSTATALLRDKDGMIKLERKGFEDGQRIEDFRLFNIGAYVFSNHHIVTANHTEKMQCKIAVSSVGAKDLTLMKVIELPIKTAKVEKNWMFFAEGRESVYCIYSLNPYRIFRATSLADPFEEVVTESLGITEWFHNSYISSSTNPVRVGDVYVMWFHTKNIGVYFAGCCLIDAESKRITHYTRHSITLPFNKLDGFQKNLLYVSGSVYLPETNVFRVFAGENDTNAMYYDFDATTLINHVKQYPV